MEFLIRKVGVYLDVQLRHESTQIDIGLLNEEGRRKLARQLEEAIDELMGGIPVSGGVNMKNTWPGGYRHAMDQDEHERWNSYNYPGTRELCSLCEEPTGRCGEDSIYIDDETGESVGPLCQQCYENSTIFSIPNHIGRCDE